MAWLAKGFSSRSLQDSNNKGFKAIENFTLIKSKTKQLIFLKKNIFSDQAHFDIVQQNDLIWGKYNSQIFHNKPIHSQRITD